MAILNAETLSLLSGTSWEFSGISFDGTLGTPTRPQQLDFGTVSTSEGLIYIAVDSEIAGVDYFGGEIIAEIGESFELISPRYEYLSARQRIETLDLTGTVLTVNYGLYVEVYDKIV